MSNVFGQFLRRRRVVLDISLREAAAHMGVTNVAWSQVERGVREPFDRTYWPRLATLFQCDEAVFESLVDDSQKEA